MSRREAVALEFVRRDGQTETGEASGRETVLGAAESAGVALPFGCRTGVCGTCVARLDDGDIRYVRPPRALKPRQSEAGYVLTCVARPRSDCRLTVGTAVQTELLQNPWK